MLIYLMIKGNAVIASYLQMLQKITIIKYVDIYTYTYTHTYGEKECSIM